MRKLVLVPLATAALLAGAVPAGAYEGTTVGDKYRDGLDSRYSATTIMSAARSVGYTGTAYTSGRQVDLAWEDGAAAQVVGYFGHSDPGYFLVNEGATDATNEQIYAGYTEMERVLPYAGFRAWKEYVPFVDADDIRLAILGGCKTSRTHDPTLNNFEDVAKQIGIDSLVTFSGDIYYPQNCGTSCVYSGNYFWERVGVYLKSGRTISNALASARTDLVAKEGSALGYGTYRVTGTVPAPDSVRLTPAGSGEALTSQPLETLPVSLDSLEVTSSTDSPEGWTLEESAQGATVRRETATGRVIDVIATASTEGLVTLEPQDATEVADAFVESNAPELADQISDWAVASVSHGDGQALAGLTWRSATDHVTVEVDRRTGAVTYFAWAKAPTRTGERLVDAAAAQRLAAASIAPADTLLAVERFDWERPYWLVRSRGPVREDGLSPRLHITLIDAETGGVVRRTTT